MMPDPLAYALIGALSVMLVASLMWAALEIAVGFMRWRDGRHW